MSKQSLHHGQFSIWLKHGKPKTPNIYHDLVREMYAIMIGQYFRAIHIRVNIKPLTPSNVYLCLIFRNSQFMVLNSTL